MKLAGIDQQHGVAVRLGVDHGLGADVVAGAGLVLDHELLAEPLGQPLADQPRQNVGGAARRIADHEANRPGRIVQRRGAAAGQTRAEVPMAIRPIAVRRESCSFSLSPIDSVVVASDDAARCNKQSAMRPVRARRAATKG